MCHRNVEAEQDEEIKKEIKRETLCDLLFCDFFTHVYSDTRYVGLSCLWVGPLL